MTDPALPGDAPKRLESFLQSEREPRAAGPERLGRLAVMHGCLTLPQLEEALAEQDHQACQGVTPDRLGRILVRRGWIDEKTLEVLLEKQAGRLPAVPEFRRYEIRRRLGEGAMSVVYEAADRELARPVALKLLKESLALNAASRDRLRIEAQTLARLSHPNVVAVYDFAEEAGQAGVVMELMDGRSLRTLLTEKKLATRDLLELLEKVAAGVQHAHEHGIIHRDLKPENILIGSADEPKVADFGLARIIEAGASISATGSRKGTPLYMAPEQVEGRTREITPRTDVYALGVLLYEILAGRPPFSGESLAEVFSRILSEDPAPPRRFNDKVHSDLETIALKAIERDPARRYPTAREFADELRRYLSGEAIQARPAGVGRRFYRRLRKTPFLAGLSIGTAVALVAAVGLWISAGKEARRAQAAREAALGAHRELARASLETALAFRRVGQNDRIPKVVPRLEEAYRQAIQLAPDAAEPHYLMGRFQRVLLKNEAALQFQEEALRKNASFAPALYERILLVSRRYRYQLIGARQRQEQGDSATLEEVEEGSRDLRKIRDQLLGDCDRLEKLIAASDPAASSPIALGEANVTAARGIVAYNRGLFDEAIERLKEAVAKDPLLEEAWESLIDAVFDRPFRRLEETERASREAEHYCEEALTLDRGYLPHLVTRADIRHIRGDDRMCRGQDPTHDFEGAEKDLSDALRANPIMLDALRGRGDLRTGRGVYAMGRGENPEPHFTGAEKDFDEGLRLRPGNIACLRRRGIVRIQRGLYRELRGADPFQDWSAAEQDLVESSRRVSGDPAIWRSLGLVRLLRGSARMARGEDPTADFDEAEKNLTASIQVGPSYSVGWRDRGTLRMMRGLHKKSRRQDPEADFAAAQEDLDRGVRGGREYAGRWLSSEFMPPLVARARLRIERAAVASDPAADWTAAAQDLERAIAFNVRDADAFAARARLRLQRREWREALQDLTRAIELNPLLESRLAQDRDDARKHGGTR
jgi:serine/threonine-protein kinase